MISIEVVNRNQIQNAAETQKQIKHKDSFTWAFLSAFLSSIALSWMHWMQVYFDRQE